MRVSLAAATLLAGLVTAVPGRASDKLTVVLDWFVNPDHAPLIVAAEKGFFRDAGLDVELIAPADPNDPPKMVAAGRADVAISYQPQLLLQAAAGLPLTRIGTLIDTPLNSLLVLKAGPIQSIADLKGRKIGYSVAGVEEALLAAILEHAGLSLKDVELVNVNFSLAPALLTGQVDAVIGAYRNFELNQVTQEGRPGRAFFLEELGVPPYDELIMVANSDKLADPRLPRFLDAVERGTLYLVNNPEESWALLIKNHKELDDALNRKAFADTVARFDHSPSALDRRRYVRFAAFMKDRKLIQAVPPLDHYATELP